MKQFFGRVSAILAGLLLLIVILLVAERWGDDVPNWVFVVVGILAFGFQWLGVRYVAPRLRWNFTLGISFMFTGLVLLFMGATVDLLSTTLSAIGGACLFASAMLIIAVPLLRRRGS